MKIFTKKGILQKTIIAILIVFCVNFIIPTYSSAGIGGVVGNAILDLTASLGDVFESLMQFFMTGQFAAGEALIDSDVMAYYDDSRVKTGGSNPIISVKEDDLDLGHLASKKVLRVPVIEYTPEEIFSNKIPYLDINFINPKWTSTNSEYKVDGSASVLQETISSWYVALRNLAIVGLLCVLVYVGIRILLTSTASDKAKYKQMFVDWLVALCLLFFLHYIMSFTLVLIDSINDAIAGEGYTADSVVISVDGTTYTTNLMGAARFMVQTKETLQRFAYCAIYIVLVAYTAIFTWHYLKRVLMMAFLTIIAPLVALTYPIDKMGDGKAQAFNMWLKEYIYNALIQPFHLIIYMVFVGSAMDLAKSNFIYAIAAIAFILPAEKILKKMFGFDRAPLGTMGAIAGFTFGSLSSKLGKSSGGGAKGGNSSSNEDSNNKPPRYEKSHGTDGIDYAEDHQHAEGAALDDGFKSSSNEEQQNRNSLNAQETNAQEQQHNLGMQDNGQQADEKQKEQQNENAQRGMANGENGEEQKKGTLVGRAGRRIVRGTRNVVSAHGGLKKSAIKKYKTLRKGAKFAVRTGMTVGGAMVGAGFGLASGKGITGVIAGATAGKNLGNRAGRAMSDLPDNVYGFAKQEKNKMLTKAYSEIDTFFDGKTKLQHNADVKEYMKKDSTKQYVRDKWTKEHNGVAPTHKQVKQELDAIKPYVDEGLTDMGAIYNARKAEPYGVDSRQSAKIALLAKDRNITSDILTDDKKYAARQKALTQEFMDKRGMNQENASKFSTHVLDVMKVQQGVAHDLRRPTNTQTAQSNARTRTRTTRSTNTSNIRTNVSPQQLGGTRANNTTRGNNTSRTNNTTSTRGRKRK